MSAEAKKKSTEVDPVTILEKLGIDDYNIDYEGKRVLLSSGALKRVARYVSFTMPYGCSGFQEGGWWWVKNTPT